MIRYLVIFISLIACELAYFKIADKCNIIDKPNERSSHSKVVLRGGGVIFLCGMLFWFFFFGMGHIYFIIGLFLITLVSFVDDIRPLPDRMRLVVQFIAMSIMFQELGILKLDFIWMIVVALILCVGIINVYNFMDGVNGMTGGYSLVVLLSLLYINNQLLFIDNSYIIVAILSDFVFCIFNFRQNARCFAGDVGSVGMAFIVVFLIGKLIIMTQDITYLILLLVYGIDACLTIVHRILLHEHLGKAHRKHCYQIMANELHIKHTNVSIIYMVIQTVISMSFILLKINHWSILFSWSILLSCSYLIFMKKYYHLHEEYLASLEKK